MFFEFSIRNKLIIIIKPFHKICMFQEIEKEENSKVNDFWKWDQKYKNEYFTEPLLIALSE